MTANDSTWDADWQKRIFIHLREKGYETINDFLRHFPAEPYVDVCQQNRSMGCGNAIGRGFRCKKPNIRGQFAVRRWIRSRATLIGDSRLVGQLTTKAFRRLREPSPNTSTSVVIDGQSAEFKSRIREIYQALKALQPPNGWRPIGANDPLIQEAFERGWPECVKPIMPVK